jgi:hypothetical protein
VPDRDAGGLGVDVDGIGLGHGISFAATSGVL